MTRRAAEPFDPYAVLGLPAGATRADVRRAYRARAKAIHPDMAGRGAPTADATTDMSRLNRARDELLRCLPSVHPKPRQPRPRPEGAEDHESAWPDHWSAWNELPRRGGPPKG